VTRRKYSTANPSADRLLPTPLDQSLRNLLTASCSDGVWQKHESAVHSFCRFEHEVNTKHTWPLPLSALSGYITWCFETPTLKAATVSSYLSSLRTLHIMRGLPHSQFDEKILKILLQGGKNLELYQPKSKHRCTMTLATLKILGHQISMLHWSELGKQVLWTACTVAFFGAFRMGELLPRGENSYLPEETLLWGDVKLYEDRALILIKCSKNKTVGGESVDIFQFPGHGVCPLAGIRKLRELSGGKDNLPVFSFHSGVGLTTRTFNALLRQLLEPILGADSRLISGHSFRSAIPSSLARFPQLSSSNEVMGWGRWKSSAYLAYTKLKVDQKRAIFSKIATCLNNSL
jgi:hypothetical protein